MVFSSVSALMNMNEQDKMPEEGKDGITETQAQQGKLEKMLQEMKDGITETQTQQGKLEKTLEEMKDSITETRAQQVKQSKMLEEMKDSVTETRTRQVKQSKMLDEMKDSVTETRTRQVKQSKMLEEMKDSVTETRAQQVKQSKMLEEIKDSVTETRAQQVKQEKMLEEMKSGITETLAWQGKQTKMLMNNMAILSKRSCSTKTQFQGPTSIGNLLICGSGSNHLNITSSDTISDKESDCHQTSNVENDCSASSSAQKPAEMSHLVDSPVTCSDFHREDEGNQSDVSRRYKLKEGNDVDLANVQHGQHGQESISYLALGSHQHDQTDHSDHHVYDNVHGVMDHSKGQTGLKMFDERDDQSDLDSDDDDERHDTGRKDDNEEDIPSPDGVFDPSKPDMYEIDDGGVLPGLPDPHLSGISFLKEPSHVSEGTPIDQGHDGSSGMQAVVETSEESVLVDSSVGHQNVDGVDMPGYQTELDGLYINSVSEIDFRPVSTVKNREMEICTNLSKAASSASECSRSVVSTFPQQLNQLEFTSNADFKKTLSSSKGNSCLVPSSGIKEKTDGCGERSVSETLLSSAQTDDGTEQSERAPFPSVPHAMPAGIGWYRSATSQDVHIRSKPSCEGLLSTNLSQEDNMPPLHLEETRYGTKGAEAHHSPLLSYPVWVGNSVNSTGRSFSATLSEAEQAGNGILRMKGSHSTGGSFSATLSEAEQAGNGILRMKGSHSTGRSFSATLSEAEQAGNGILRMKGSLFNTVADSVCAGNGIQGTRRPHSAPLLCSAGFGNEVRVSEHSVGDGQLGPDGPLSASCPDDLHSADAQPKL